MESKAVTPVWSEEGYCLYQVSAIHLAALWPSFLKNDTVASLIYTSGHVY